MFNEVEVFGDVFALGVNDDLNRISERVENGSIGEDGSFLFGFGEEVEINGGGGHDQTAGTIGEYDDIIENVFNI